MRRRVQKNVQNKAAVSNERCAWQMHPGGRFTRLRAGPLASARCGRTGLKFLICCRISRTREAVLAVVSLLAGRNAANCTSNGLKRTRPQTTEVGDARHKDLAEPDVPEAQVERAFDVAIARREVERDVRKRATAPPILLCCRSGEIARAPRSSNTSYRYDSGPVT